MPPGCPVPSLEQVPAPRRRRTCPRRCGPAAGRSVAGTRSAMVVTPGSCASPTWSSLRTLPDATVVFQISTRRRCPRSVEQGIGQVDLAVLVPPATTSSALAHALRRNAACASESRPSATKSASVMMRSARIARSRTTRVAPRAASTPWKPSPVLEATRRRGWGRPACHMRRARGRHQPDDAFATGADQVAARAARARTEPVHQSERPD